MNKGINIIIILNLISGLKIKYNLTKPVGNRIESIKVCCEKDRSDYKPIVNNEVYDVVTVDELVQGVDNYTHIKEYVNKVNYFGKFIC